MLGRKNNVKTILEKDTCVYARTRMNLHLHAFCWDVPSGTYEHLFSTLVRRRAAEAHPPPPPAPGVTPVAAHWPVVAVTHGRRPRWKTPHAAAHVTGDASPPGTRRAGEAARGRRARPFPAGPPVSQPRASPPSCAETISRRRDNAKRRPGPASRAPAMPSVRPATQSTRLLSLHDGIPGTLPQCDEPLTRHPPPHPSPTPCAPAVPRLS